MKTKVVRLLPTNKRHKQLIKQHGDIWLAPLDPEPMQCFNGEIGLWIITVYGKLPFQQHSRNVQLTDIEEIQT